MPGKIIPKNNWFKIVNSKVPFKQGDVLFGCPIANPQYNFDEGEVNEPVDTEIIEYDVILLSQSCDIQNEKIKLVLVSPVHTLTKFIEAKPEFSAKRMKEKLKDGEFHAYHLLNKPNKSNFIDDFFVVDFHNVYGVPIDTLRSMIKKQKRRLTLISPYTEHLSQSFARYFMRVGLPSDIPSFT